MTLNRPRLLAIMLCGLIVLMLGYLLVKATAPSHYRFVHSPAALEVRAVDMPAPPPELPKVEFLVPETASRIAPPGPDVAPSAAPGVAFNYRYAFRLPAQRIAAVQERHAQMCERLTVAKCRITGMFYRVVDDRDIEAMLAIKVDPSVARLFGRQGVEAVAGAGGMLTESEISGTEVATSIRESGRSLAELEAGLARVESRLRQRNLSYDERVRLDDEARQLRTQIRALRDNRDAEQESLATTPMAFRYGSGDLIPGFAQRPTVRQAMDRAGANFVDGATMLLIVLVTLLPWAVALGLVGLLFRIAGRRWLRPTAGEVA